MDQYEAVLEFHRTYNMPIGTRPTLLDYKRENLRMKLIEEEFKELIDGVRSGDIVAIADALGDLSYVVNGMAIEMGIVMPGIIRVIQESNMSKLGEDGKPIYREDGKVLKGPNFKEPDIYSELVRQGYEPPNLP